MEMCPVCAKEDAKKDINGMLDGIIYYFCCEECKNNFLATPTKYINCCQDDDLSGGNDYGKNL